MRFPLRPATALVAAIALAGCASLPREHGYAQTNDLIKARLGTAPTWSPVSADAAGATPAPDIPTAPLSADQAIRLAFVYNPHMREEYTRLGLGRAELEQARRIANPRFGYAALDSQRGEGSQITRSVSLSFTDLLLLPARKRFAQGELDRLQKTVAAKLLDLTGDVEKAWFASVGANQVVAMRDIVATAAERSAELAQRFFDAGNINRLQLEQELAAAALARIAAVRAAADALRARSELASVIGLPIEAAWTTVDQLPAPSASGFLAEQLVALALEQRLDLAAARQELTLREDALGVTRRWRWLGAVEVGYERESESDGGVMRGPSLALELPIFNQGQAAIMRAEAELIDARARLDGLALSVHNQARLGVERLAMTRDIAERYRTALVPRREAIVSRTQEHVNFMLMGVFELIHARQQEYDAYQEYLEAVRDYWTARAELRRVVGGRLPDDGEVPLPTLGVEAILPAETAPVMDHSKHAMPSSGDASGGAGQDSPPLPTRSEAGDPHAGHRMPTPAKDSAPDPHAGHRMPMSGKTQKVTPASHDRSTHPAPRPAESKPADDEHVHDDHGDTP